MEKNDNVAITGSNDPYISRLESERAALEQSIKELHAEIRVINNLIYRKKSETFAAHTDQITNLKNMDRLFFETIILDILHASQHGFGTRRIYDALLKKGYNVNYNTLRSYVVRMRDKKLIKKRLPGLNEWVAASGLPTSSAKSSSQ